MMPTPMPVPSIVVVSGDRDKAMTAMGKDFQPGELDVLCLRGTVASQHPGNLRFKEVVKDNLHRYSKAKNKFEKTLIVSEIVEVVRTSSPSGGFIKKQGGHWFKVGEHFAREKVSQSLRDMLHGKYRSSTTAKKIQRKSSQMMIHNEVDQILGGSAAKLFVRRVEQLTLHAKNDLDYQRAFNQANRELLQIFKAR